MLLRMKSELTGEFHDMNIPKLTETAWGLYMTSEFRSPTKQFFPYLTMDEQRFILRGITPEEWEELTKELN